MKIVINETEHGLQWGMGALEDYCDTMNCDIDELDRIFIPKIGVDEKPYITQQKAMVQLILSGLKNYAELNGEELEVTKADVQLWCDENGFETITNDFLGSKLFGKTVANYIFGEELPAADEPKKKARHSVK